MPLTLNGRAGTPYQSENPRGLLMPDTLPNFLYGLAVSAIEHLETEPDTDPSHLAEVQRFAETKKSRSK